MTDPFETDDWKGYALRVEEELIPKLADSFATISLVPSGASDVKFAVELGLSIMMDKPIIAVIPPGAKIPAKLAAVADEIVEFDRNNPDGVASRISQAIARIANEEQG